MPKEGDSSPGQQGEESYRWLKAVARVRRFLAISSWPIHDTKDGSSSYEGQ